MSSEPNNSQQSHSSFSDSIVSRASGRNPITSGGLRPISREEFARETTPSTSLSNSSTQERPGSTSSVYEVGISRSPILGAANGNTSLGNQASQSTNIKSYFQNLHHAPKRTASGQVKRSGQRQQSSPDGISQGSHSRHTSTASRSSQISDMSNDLCARLSYAVFKVQNGLQSHNLDQLEAMALQRETPPPGTSPRQSAIKSPISAFRTIQSPGSPEKRSFTQQTSSYGLPMAWQPQQPNHSIHPPPSQESSLDRSSWLSNATANTFENVSSQHSPKRGPVLAPPVDIIPRGPRGRHTDNVQQPRLDTRALHRHSMHEALSPVGSSITPSTPPRRLGSNIRAPNPKSAEEQDAVETLISMSSPGNPAYHAALHAPISPLPKHLNTSPKRVSPAKLSTNADIDQVLDQMPDRYSSSDEDAPFA
ncbi:MAG: hypothetical protein Q9213_001471 [Squamulea squamosa]